MLYKTQTVSFLFILEPDFFLTLDSNRHIVIGEILYMLFLHV